MLAREFLVMTEFVSPRQRNAPSWDGQTYNWSIQQRWFPGFKAVADFIHVVEYVYEAAKALYDEPAERWKQYVAFLGRRPSWRGDLTDPHRLYFAGRPP